MTSGHLAALAPAVTAALGEGWTHLANPDNSGRMLLDGPDNVRLEIARVDGRVGRVSFTARPPASVPVGLVREVRPDEQMRPTPITVSATRSPEAVAAEISRRLLPAAREWAAAYVANHAAHLNDRAARHKVRDRIAELTGSKVDEEGEAATRSEMRGWFAHQSAYATWTLANDGQTVSMAMRSVPAHIAIDIAALIGSHR